MERKQEENWHIVGVIPEHIAKQIGLDKKTPIWISDKIVRHIDNNHGMELRKRNTTALSFVHRVVNNFDNVYRQADGTLILAIESEKTAMVTYIKMELATQNYWRVRSAHVRKITELSNYSHLWFKKKPATRK